MPSAVAAYTHSASVGKVVIISSLLGKPGDIALRLLNRYARKRQAGIGGGERCALLAATAINIIVRDRYFIFADGERLAEGAARRYDHHYRTFVVPANVSAQVARRRCPYPANFGLQGSAEAPWIVCWSNRPGISADLPSWVRLPGRRATVVWLGRSVRGRPGRETTAYKHLRLPLCLEPRERDLWPVIILTIGKADLSLGDVIGLRLRQQRLFQTINTGLARLLGCRLLKACLLDCN